jgi:putative salt-induced outer membrane protein
MKNMPLINCRRLRHLAVACSLAFLATPVSAFAQAAAAAPPPPPPPKHEGTAELAFVGTTGNSKETTLSTGAEYIARPTNWLLKNRFQVVRGETDDVVTTESWLYGFRAERFLNARLSAFGEYAFFRDPFAGIDTRNGVTGGLMFTIVKADRQTLSADAGLGYLSEKRLAGEDVSSGTYSGGAAYKLKFSQTAELNDELRLLGTFDNTDDWRVSNTISVTAKLTTLFSMKFSSTVRHLNFPPPGYTGTDTVTSVAFVAAFKSKPK